MLFVCEAQQSGKGFICSDGQWWSVSPGVAWWITFGCYWNLHHEVLHYIGNKCIYRYIYIYHGCMDLVLTCPHDYYQTLTWMMTHVFLGNEALFTEPRPALKSCEGQNWKTTRKAKEGQRESQGSLVLRFFCWWVFCCLMRGHGYRFRGPFISSHRASNGANKTFESTTWFQDFFCTSKCPFKVKDIVIVRTSRLLKGCWAHYLYIYIYIFFFH